jgi:ABC-type glutathione transport system ATPase component
LTALSLLDIRNLTVSYSGEDGPVTAVHDISLTLAAGQAIGIVGESGSGKSSIAGAILDSLGPSARLQGSILFEGRDLALLGSRERRSVLGRRIGSVFQDPFTALNPALRVGRQIAEPMIRHLGPDRGCACLRAAAPDSRRADHGARRDRGGADSGAAGEPTTAQADRDAVHQP